MYVFLKIAISAGLIVAISELAKRFPPFAAFMASLPLTSILAFIWMHVDKSDPESIAQLSTGIFWLVLPSLVLFIAFPWLLRSGTNFWIALAGSSALTAAAYGLMLITLRRFGISL